MKTSILFFCALNMICFLLNERQAFSQPQMVSPDQFDIELFADFEELGRLKAWQLTITSGEQGFPPGLYVTSGPIPDDRSDRLIHIDIEGNINVVKDGFKSNESLVFARGLYGEGMLISEPQEQRIVRLLSDGTISTFAAGFTPPFGPAVLMYGPDPLNPSLEILYATDFSSGNMLLVGPEGEISFFASVGANAKSALLDRNSQYGGLFVGSTFNFSDNPDAGTIFSVSADGQSVAILAEELNGIQILAFGPGGVFGSDLYVPSEGRDFPELLIGDGAVYTMDNSGELTPFITNIDASSVAFDTMGILDGGMFVADIFDNPDIASKIWRVTPKTTHVDNPKPDNPSVNFVLAQNYPNPFNPWTKIDYFLPEKVEVTLKIFNISGTEEIILVQERQSAGNYSVQWDGRDNEGQRVSNGVYICHLTAGTFSTKKKMILLK